MTTLDYSIVTGYLLMMLALGVYAQFQQSNTEDYYVGGRRLGTLSIAVLWMASWVGGASVIGSAGRAHNLGITAVWYCLALAIGCFIFAALFAAKVKRLGDVGQYLTYPDLIEDRFDGRTRLIATLTTALSFIAFAAGQLAASATIIEVIFGWSFAQSLLLATSIVVAYTAIGGFLAITYTDWLQIILLVLGVVVIGLPIAILNGGTPDNLLNNLPPERFDLGAWGWPAIIALVVSISMSFIVSMDSFTRSYSAKSPSAARNGPFLAVILIIIIGGAATWIGLTAGLLFPDVASGDNVLPLFIEQLFPTGLKGLVLVGLLAAVMSTADICILTVSANTTHDVYQRFMNPAASEQQLFNISIAASALIGLLAGLMAWQMQDVIDILLIGFTINGAALVIPTIAAIYWRHTDSNPAFWSMLAGLTTVLGWHGMRLITSDPVFSIDPLWPGLFAAATVFVIGHRHRAPWTPPAQVGAAP